MLLMQLAPTGIQPQNAHILVLFEVVNDEIVAIRHIILLDVDVAELQGVKLVVAALLLLLEAGRGRRVLAVRCGRAVSVSGGSGGSVLVPDKVH